MATTTTYALIRDHQIALIEALVPAIQSQHRFRRGSKRQPLVEMASDKPSSAFLRRFEIRRELNASDPAIQDPDARETSEAATLTVAYPMLPSLYGEGELDDMEEAMRSDARLIRDALFSPDSYLAGQSIAKVTIQGIDRSRPTIWFQTFGIDLVYTEAQGVLNVKDQALAAFDASGAPLTGLTPTWACLRDVRTEQAAAEPAITELGLGLYSSQVPAGVAGIVDLGVTAYPRYVHVESALSHWPTFAAFAVDGSPLPLLNPTWHSVVTTSGGSAITPQPTFTGLGGGVYRVNGLSPGHCGIVDLGTTADPRYVFVDGK
jgi:hypothetical protein